MKHHYLKGVGLLLVALLWPMVSHAFFNDHVYAIINRASGQAMEIGGSYGESMQLGRIANQWPYWGGAKQQWYIRELGRPGAGTFAIINRGSGQTLEIGAASMNDWATANQWSAQGTVHQQWDVKPQANGSWIIINLWSDKLLLPRYSSTSAGAQITQALPPGSTAPTSAQWDIVDVSTNQNWFELVNVNSGKVLASNPDQVQQNPSWRIASQQWSFSPASNGNFYIINRYDQRVLEIGGGNQQPGASINVWENYGHLWQQWGLLAVNDSHQLTAAEAMDGRIFKIYSPHAGKILEIGGSYNQTMSDAAPANTWYDYSNPNQQWYVRYITLNRSAAGSGSTASGAGQQGASAGQAQVLTLYPNPAKDVLTLQAINLDEHVAVTATDLRGAIVTPPYLGQGRVDVSGMAPGVYLLAVKVGPNTYHRKFVKE